MTDFTPNREDHFSFGLWTVGWQGVDVFGGAVREPLDPAEAVRRLSDLGAWGITFHDDDVMPFGSSASERQARLAGHASELRRHAQAEGPGATGQDRAVLRDPGAHLASLGIAGRAFNRYAGRCS